MLQHQKKEHHHYICFYCKQIYETQKDMDLHIRSIHSFICFYCKKVLRTKIGVENHIKALHEQTNTKIVQTIHHEEYSSETIDNSAYNADEWENLRAKRIQELRDMEKDR